MAWPTYRCSTFSDNPSHQCRVCFHFCRTSFWYSVSGQQIENKNNLKKKNQFLLQAFVHHSCQAVRTIWSSMNLSLIFCYCSPILHCDMRWMPCLLSTQKLRLPNKVHISVKNKNREVCFRKLIFFHFAEHYSRVEYLPETSSYVDANSALDLKIVYIDFTVVAVFGMVRFWNFIELICTSIDNPFAHRYFVPNQTVTKIFI